MDSVTVEVTGLKELQAALNELPYALARQSMRSALSAAGDVLLDAATMTAPVRTGLLREDEVEKVVTQGNLDFNSVRVGPAYDRSHLPTGKDGKVQTAKSPGVYGRFLEFGTSKLAARPWLRPAFESSKVNALTTFVRTLADGLAAAVTKSRKN